MKTDIKEIAKTFAKENKVSVTKIENLLRSALKEQTKNMGKQPTPETVAIRNKLIGMTGSLSGKMVTAVEVAGMLKTDIQTANNAIRYVATAHGGITRAGLQPRNAGEKGRRAVLWKIS